MLETVLLDAMFPNKCKLQMIYVNQRLIYMNQLREALQLSLCYHQEITKILMVKIKMSLKFQQKEQNHRRQDAENQIIQEILVALS